MGCYRAARREANRERTRAYDRARYWAEPEKKRAVKSSYYCGAAKARIQERSRLRAAAKPEEARARKRSWYWANLERARAQHRRDAANRRASCAGRTAAPATAEERSALVAPGRMCFYCGHAPAQHVDHFVPLARWAVAPLSDAQRAEGPDHINNLVGACAHCNLSKGAQVPDPSVWRGGRP